VFDSRQKQEVILYFAAFSLSLDPNRPYNEKQVALLLGIKRFSREPDQLPQSSEENKNDIDVRLFSRTNFKTSCLYKLRTKSKFIFFAQILAFLGRYMKIIENPEESVNYRDRNNKSGTPLWNLIV
jgi:hypothetical protein